MGSVPAVSPTPVSPPSGPAQRLFQEHPAKSKFLAAKHAGVRLRSGAEPVLYLNDPAGKPIGDRRQLLDVVNQLNEEELARSGDPAVATRIAQ